METLHHLVLMDDAAVWIVWKRIGGLIGGLRSTAPFYHLSPAQSLTSEMSKVNSNPQEIVGPKHCDFFKDSEHKISLVSKVDVRCIH